MSAENLIDQAHMEIVRRDRIGQAWPKAWVLHPRAFDELAAHSLGGPLSLSYDKTGGIRLFGIRLEKKLKQEPERMGWRNIEADK